LIGGILSSHGSEYSDYGLRELETIEEKGQSLRVDSEDGASTFLQKVGIYLPDCMA
jgi:hypothetical protein